MSFEGIVLNPGKGQKNSVMADPYTFKASDRDTGGAYSLTEFTTTGDSPPPHIHRNEEEAFYVLEGEVNVRIGVEIVTGTSGSFVLVPRGMVHAFPNAGNAPARMLVIISPAGLANREISRNCHKLCRHP